MVRLFDCCIQDVDRQLSKHQAIKQFCATTYQPLQMQKNRKRNLFPAKLIEATIAKQQGQLSSAGALVVKTGKFTGRSPKDRFIVEDNSTKTTVDWGAINLPIDQKSYEALAKMVKDYANSLETVYVRDVYACANPNYRLNVRIHTEFPWQNLFVYNMFLRLKERELETFEPDWEVYAFPSVLADPKKHNTRQENFSIINFTMCCLCTVPLMSEQKETPLYFLAYLEQEKLLYRMTHKED